MHAGMHIFSYFDVWNSCPKFIRTFQLHSVYSIRIQDIIVIVNGINLEILAYLHVLKPPEYKKVLIIYRQMKQACIKVTVRGLN
jgi:hypothetical protein